jgi:hypothetical protein
MAAKAALEFAGLLVRARNESAVVLLDLLDRSCLARRIDEFALPGWPWPNEYADGHGLRIVAPEDLEHSRRRAC